MYDVFLSYSHRELERAQDVYLRLTGEGLRVWMDDPGPDADTSELGIPAGALHQQVIQAAITNSGTIVIVDGEAWRSSEDCRSELAIARHLGRRVFAIGTHPDALPNAAPTDLHLQEESLTYLVDDVRQGALFAAAQVRLDTLPATPVGRWGGTSYTPGRLLTPTPGSDDALTLISDVEFGHLVTEDQADRCDRLMTTERHRRHRLRRTSTGLIAMLTLAVLVAGLGMLAAQSSRAEAETSLNYADSLLWAEESLADPHSGTAFEAATHSVARQRNEFSIEALLVATSRSRRLLTWPIPIGVRYHQLTFSPDDRDLLALGDGELLRIRDGQILDRLTVSSAGVRQTLQWVSPGHAWLLNDGRLRQIAITDDEMSLADLDVDEVSALVGVPDGSAIIGREDGSVSAISAKGSAEPRINLGHRITGLALAGESLYVTTQRYAVHRYRLSEGLLLHEWTSDLADTDVWIDQNLGKGVTATTPDTKMMTFPSAIRRLSTLNFPRKPWARDLIQVCDDTVTIVYESVELDAVRTTIGSNGTPVGSIRRSPYTSSIGCWRSQPLFAGAHAGDLGTGRTDTSPAVLGPSDRTEYTALAVSNDGAYLAVVSSIGELRIADHSVPTVRELGMAHAAIPLSDERWLLQDITGALHVASPDEVHPLGVRHEPLGYMSEAGVTIVAENSQRLSRATDTGLSHFHESTQPFELVALGEDAEMIAYSLEGGHISIVRVADGADTGKGWTPPLKENESLADIALEGQNLYAISNLGRIWRVDVSTGLVQAEGSVSVNGGVQLVARPGSETGVVVHSMKGRLDLLDANFTPVASRRVHPAGALRATQVGGFVIWDSFSRMIFDGERLALIDTIAVDGFDVVDNVSLRPSPDGQSVFLWRQALAFQPGVLDPRTGFVEGDSLTANLEDVDESGLSSAELVVIPVCLDGSLAEDPRGAPEPATSSCDT